MMIADYRTRLRRPRRNPRGIPHDSTASAAAIARDSIGTYRAKFRGARFGHGLYNGYFAQKMSVDPWGSDDLEVRSPTPEFYGWLAFAYQQETGEMMSSEQAKLLYSRLSPTDQKALRVFFALEKTNAELKAREEASIRATLLADELNRLNNWKKYIEEKDYGYFECFATCVRENIEDVLTVIKLAVTLMASAEALMELPARIKIIPGGVEEMTSIGNRIFQISRRSAFKNIPGIRSIGNWARTSGTFAETLPGIRHPNPVIRRFVKSGRTLVRAARGGLYVAGTISLAIEAYCATACLNCDYREKLFIETYGPKVSE